MSLLVKVSQAAFFCNVKFDWLLILKHTNKNHNKIVSLKNIALVKIPAKFDFIRIVLNEVKY